MSTPNGPIVPDPSLYNLIAARLIMDPGFYAFLLDNQRHAIIQTLQNAGVKYTGNDINYLLYQWDRFTNTELGGPGEDAILDAAKQYLLQGPTMADTDMI
jgi:hypothetical protein